MSRRTVVLCGLAGLALGSSAALAVTPVDVILKEGAEILPGVTVTGLNTPFTTGSGKVGFVVQGSDSSRSIWFDTGIVFNSNDALPDSLTGGEGTMGVSDSGGFIYSPTFNGNDAVYGQGGLILRETDPAPGFDGRWISFASRPTMTPDGTAHWVSGLTSTQGGSSQGRTLYRAIGDTITPVVSSGDIVSGFPVSATGIGFGYHVSDNSQHVIMEMIRTTGSTANDAGIYYNGSIVAQEGSPTGQGDNWQAFSGVSVNNSGNYLFAGDTNGPAASDAFLAYNGQIGVREGDTIDGVTLASGAVIRSASINNLNQSVYIWGWGSGATLQEHLFFSPDSTDLSGTAVRLLSVGDLLDVNGDTVADVRLTDFMASLAIAPGLDFADDGFVYVEVELTDLATGAETEAIIRVAVPAPGAAALFALAGVAGLRRRR